MLIKKSIQDTIFIIAQKFGLEEVQNELAIDKYRLRESSDFDIARIGVIYTFDIELLSSSIAVSEDLIFSCDSFARELVKNGFSVVVTREEDEQLGIITTLKCKTFI